MLAALMKVTWPLMMRRRLRRASERTIANAKRLVESGSA
jgi:hypothetical protein